MSLILILFFKHGAKNRNTNAVYMWHSKTPENNQNSHGKGTHTPDRNSKQCLNYASTDPRQNRDSSQYNTLNSLTNLWTSLKRFLKILSFLSFQITKIEACQFNHHLLLIFLEFPWSVQPSRWINKLGGVTKKNSHNCITSRQIFDTTSQCIMRFREDISICNVCSRWNSIKYESQRNGDHLRWHPTHP